MAAPNLLGKACIFSGIDRPSFVYVDSKNDSFVKAPFTLLAEPSRLAVRAAFTATRSDFSPTGCGRSQIAWAKLRDAGRARRARARSCQVDSKQANQRSLRTDACLAGHAVQSTTDGSGTSDRCSQWNMRHPTG